MKNLARLMFVCINPVVQPRSQMVSPQHVYKTNKILVTHPTAHVI